MAMIDGARRAVKTCMKLRKEETCLILTDTEKESIGRSLFQAAREVGAEAILTVMLPRRRHGEEPPDPVARIMRESDVILAPTEFSLSHTQARKVANDAGARIATMPTITPWMMSRGGMTADFKAIKKTADRVQRILKNATQVRIETDLGTSLEFSVRGRKWIQDTGILHKKGDFGNLPAGEIFIAPEEGTAEGILVVDGAFATIGKMDRPLKIKVERGIAVKISGGNSARKLRNVLERHASTIQESEWAYNVAEFGIGLNPKSRIIGNPLEDEKALGTVHIALGDNSTFGGKVHAGIHLDGIVLSPTVSVDHRIVIERGEMKI